MNCIFNSSMIPCAWARTIAHTEDGLNSFTRHKMDHIQLLVYQGVTKPCWRKITSACARRQNFDHVEREDWSTTNLYWSQAYNLYSYELAVVPTDAASWAVRGQRGGRSARTGGGRRRGRGASSGVHGAQAAWGRWGYAYARSWPLELLELLHCSTHVIAR
jgi:hypothetical protein